MTDSYDEQQELLENTQDSSQNGQSFIDERYELFYGANGSIDETAPVNVLDTLEDNYSQNVSYTNSEIMSYIVDKIPEFNASILVKQTNKYVPYAEFHSGYSNSGVLKGKQQLEKNSLFNIIKTMPKGCMLHAHLYTYIDFPFIVNYILENQQNWDDNLYMCLDINSNFFLRPFLLPTNTSSWQRSDCKYETDALLNPFKDLDDFKQKAISLNVMFVNKNVINNSGNKEYNNSLVEKIYNSYYATNYAKNFFYKIDTKEFVNNYLHTVDESNLGAMSLKNLIENLCEEFNLSEIPKCIFELWSFSKPFYDVFSKKFRMHYAKSKGLGEGNINDQNLNGTYYYVPNNKNDLPVSGIQPYEQVVPPPNKLVENTIKKLNALSENFTQQNKQFFTDSLNSLNKMLLKERLNDNDRIIISNVINKMSQINTSKGGGLQPKSFWKGSSAIINFDENEKIDKEIFTKWDLLEICTEMGGALAKHWLVFPAFFVKTLLNAYYDDNLSVFEMRTPIGNIYYNEIANNVLQEKRKRIEFGKEKWTRLYSKIKPDNSLDLEFIDELIKGDKPRNEFIEKINNSMYQLMLMEEINKIITCEILSNTVKNCEIESKPIKYNADNINHYKSLNYLVDKYQQPDNLEMFAPYARTCNYSGSKLQKTHETILSSFNNIINELNTNFYSNKTNYEDHADAVFNLYYDTNTEENKVTGHEKYYSIVNANPQKEVLPIQYTIIGAAAKGELAGPPTCDKTTQDVISFYLISNFLHRTNNNSRFYKNRIVGYDLYGEEDVMHSDAPFIKLLTFIKNHARNTGIPWNYYLHAGENHNFVAKHGNLITAILLDAKRIGHGFRLNSSQSLMEIVKSKGICVECAPISNQVLDYTPNVSVHPAFDFFKNGIPISISSDDQNLYGYDSLCYDWTAIINAWNLKLKQIYKILTDSILYSSASNKKQIYKDFKNRFRCWVNSVTEHNNDKMYNEKNIIEQLIVSEYVKLRKQIIPKDLYTYRLRQLKDITSKYVSQIRQENNNFIKELSQNYLVSKFVLNIINNNDTKNGKKTINRDLSFDSFFNNDPMPVICPVDTKTSNMYSQKFPYTSTLPPAYPVSTSLPAPLESSAVLASPAGGGKRFVTKKTLKRRRIKGNKKGRQTKRVKRTKVSRKHKAKKRFHTRR